MENESCAFTCIDFYFPQAKPVELLAIDFCPVEAGMFFGPTEVLSSVWCVSCSGLHNVGSGIWVLRFAAFLGLLHLSDPCLHPLEWENSIDDHKSQTVMWKKNIIWTCGVIGGCYVMWSSKDTVSTNKDGRSFKNKANSSILFPKSFEWQQMMIAETSDLYTSVGLARSPNSNASLFLPPPHKKLDKEKIREELFQLLLSLSSLESDVCVQLLTKRAKFLALQFMRKREVCYEELEDAYKIYHMARRKKASFTFDKLCLQALLGYSSMKSHRTLMFENGVLEVLLSALKLHEGDRHFESIIAQIIANLAIEDKFANAFHVTGWIGILASLSKSPYIEVKLPASKALANLDKDDFQHSFYDNGVYLLHPEVRSSKEFSADVIFVHGLLGATFWTWRQHDSMKKFNNVHKKEANNLDLSKLIGHYSTSSFYTFCWPKK
ncbi:protein SERAC1 [Caerostris extrusa]|uniref:Protein SERAC1 n=1 Tax=Caerostris extrusa TaxID=172846 RepID=A0AAV4MNY2_CAEEX|nr:protein SERAC1 [Caerostris extrusa]